MTILGSDKVTTVKITSNVPDHLSNRAWYNETSAYAFLVHAPITFGHSQLVVSFSPCISEEDAFSLAAKHIAICIARLRLAFISLDLEEWVHWPNTRSRQGNM